LTNQLKAFETKVLRPIFIMQFFLIGLLLLNHKYLWLVGVALGLFYTGFIGSSLHPGKNAQALAQGPTQGVQEDDVFSQAVKNTIISQACTHAGILIAGLTIIGLWGGLEVRWWVTLIVGFLVMMFSGAVLKVKFTNLGG